MNIDELVRLLGDDSKSIESELSGASRAAINIEGSGVAGPGALTQSEGEAQWAAAVEALGLQIESLRHTQDKHASALSENTQALLSGVAGRIGEGLATNNLAAGSLASSSLLSPWLGALVGLFRGNERTENTLPDQFVRRGSISLEQDVRASPETKVSNTPVNVSVNIHAIDSRSFSDHSDQIAEALRRALLESRSVRDVLEEV